MCINPIERRTSARDARARERGDEIRVGDGRASLRAVKELCSKHACGLRVTSIKIDSYLNVDAGTMSPFEHGEVFVLDGGGEVDLDLGNYERFLDVTLTRDNNITTGKIYQKERIGDYLGKTVQVVLHIIDAISNWIESVSLIPVDGEEGPADICVIELGGTVGDVESMPFIEALQQLSFSVENKADPT